ncbi:hypothetical protein Nepgr_007308 [Nepenthes gracilis]|uniref:Uncharacterized protein n=1 Tax=Nepenthes gracilis TaxID=150966 RepID=A0AAD3S6T4_NEPGR|nr:hypothetical protein Nepgr_007308 [Nepenthes gracilis]
MDSDCWTSRLAVAKRQFNLHHRLRSAASHLDQLNSDEFEVEDDRVRPDISCPYCYEDFDIASLCIHLEDDHSSESTPTVCPICSVKVARDMLSHITLHHGHFVSLTKDYLQRHHRLRRVAIPSSQAISILGQDLREAHLQVLFGGSGFRSNTANTTNTVIDPFLSSCALSFPSSEVDEISKSIGTSTEDSSAKNPTSANLWKPSFDSSRENIFADLLDANVNGNQNLSVRGRLKARK